MVTRNIPGLTPYGRDCSTCRAYKTWDNFHRSPRHKTKYTSDCKICRNRKYYEWKEQNPERYKAMTARRRPPERSPERRLYERTWKQAAMARPRTRLSAMISGAKRRAARDGRAFDLDVTFLLGLWDENRGACALTGIPFDMSVDLERKVGGWRPYAPSIDRIDSSRGYTRDNTRLICNAMNIALGNRGEAVFERVARAFLEKQSDHRYREAA